MQKHRLKCQSRTLPPVWHRLPMEHVVDIMIIVHGQPDLLQVVLALSSTGSFASLLNGGKQKGDQNGNDGNHHQEFDQSKTSTQGELLHITLLKKTRDIEWPVNQSSTIGTYVQMCKCRLQGIGLRIFTVELHGWCLSILRTGFFCIKVLVRE